MHMNAYFFPYSGGWLVDSIFLNKSSDKIFIHQFLKL